MENSEAFWRFISQASEDKPDQKQCHSIHPINSDVEKISGNKTVGMPEFFLMHTPPMQGSSEHIFFGGEVPRWWAIFSDALKPHQLDRFSRATSRYWYSRECWILDCTVFACRHASVSFCWSQESGFQCQQDDGHWRVLALDATYLQRIDLLAVILGANRFWRPKRSIVGDAPNIDTTGFRQCFFFEP